MKPFDELIAQRRSIRNFDATRKISQAQIETLIRSALEAPSWNNFQESRYHAVLSAELKQQLCACLAPFDAKIAANASTLLVTTFQRGRSGFKNHLPVDELGDGWGIYDLGLQNAYLLLKAADMGMDSIVLGLRDADKIRTLLAIPEEEAIVSIIAVGYRTPKEVVRPARKKTTEVATFYE